MPFVRVCSASEIPDSSMRRFLVKGEEILLVKFEDRYYAISERCTHRGGPLSEGTLEEGLVTCPWHFGQFEIKTGQVMSPPPSEALKKYEVKVESGNVVVLMA